MYIARFIHALHRQTDRRTDGQTDRRTDTHTHTHTHTYSPQTTKNNSTFKVSKSELLVKASFSDWECTVLFQEIKKHFRT